MIKGFVFTYSCSLNGAVYINNSSTSLSLNPRYVLGKGVQRLYLLTIFKDYKLIFSSNHLLKNIILNHQT